MKSSFFNYLVNGIKIAVLPSFFLIAFLGENGYPLAGVMAVAMCGAYGLDWMLKNDK